MQQSLAMSRDRIRKSNDVTNASQYINDRGGNTWGRHLKQSRRVGGRGVNRARFVMRNNR